MDERQTFFLDESRIWNFSSEKMKQLMLDRIFLIICQTKI